MTTSTIPRIRKPSRIFRWVFLFFFVVLRVLLFLFLFICTFFAPPFSDSRMPQAFLLPATYRGGVITHLIYILHIPAKHFMNEFLLIYEFYYLLFTQPQILSFNAKAAHRELLILLVYAVVRSFFCDVDVMWVTLF